MLARKAKATKSQWTAQFLVAAELTRMGYSVSFTMGNHTPYADLTVGLPDGRQFWVDVKGQASKGTWLLGRKAVRQDLHYILVLVGNTRDGDRFFILDQTAVNELTAQYEKAHPKQKVIKGLEGCGYKAVADYADKWDSLPH